ncbi:hypothetical protein TBLA_0I01170 [Henningerozyma blattae CBS 6284]|uniref:Uncharacterized protein n=1 Tax=Henningerozyma blattae (strain ATCC 34711 / CBS 6284 / DSM 70876 / NBRC 10599 / NRRL Y-10934 / UCD 77-7) TaxID=1071380 RepID=I2H8S5_HENB6|nr:hypothetical protein TBLA_0I01170 [Tetrapisispora blattae CBS 6284]CCH62777.1 hypothetical protein TBLA_0I01170 [Tetrapisispora blattae CBS 6284]
MRAGGRIVTPPQEEFLTDQPLSTTAVQAANLMLYGNNNTTQTAPVKKVVRRRKRKVGSNNNGNPQYNIISENDMMYEDWTNPSSYDEEIINPSPSPNGNQMVRYLPSDGNNKPIVVRRRRKLQQPQPVYEDEYGYPLDQSFSNHSNSPYIDSMESNSNSYNNDFSPMVVQTTTVTKYVPSKNGLKPVKVTIQQRPVKKIIRAPNGVIPSGNRSFSYVNGNGNMRRMRNAYMPPHPHPVTRFISDSNMRYQNMVPQFSYPYPSPPSGAIMPPSRSISLLHQPYYDNQYVDQEFPPQFQQNLIPISSSNGSANEQLVYEDGSVPIYEDTQYSYPTPPHQAYFQDFNDNTHIPTDNNNTNAQYYDESMDSYEFEHTPDMTTDEQQRLLQQRHYEQQQTTNIPSNQDRDKILKRKPTIETLPSDFPMEYNSYADDVIIDDSFPSPQRDYLTDTNMLENDYQLEEQQLVQLQQMSRQNSSRNLNLASSQNPSSYKNYMNKNSLLSSPPPTGNSPRNSNMIRQRFNNKSNLSKREYLKKQQIVKKNKKKPTIISKRNHHHNRHSKYETLSEASESPSELESESASDEASGSDSEMSYESDYVSSQSDDDGSGSETESETEVESIHNKHRHRRHPHHQHGRTLKKSARNSSSNSRNNLLKKKSSKSTVQSKRLNSPHHQSYSRRRRSQLPTKHRKNRSSAYYDSEVTSEDDDQISISGSETRSETESYTQSGSQSESELGSEPSQDDEDEYITKVLKKVNERKLKQKQDNKHARLSNANVTPDLPYNVLNTKPKSKVKKNSKSDLSRSKSNGDKKTSIRTLDPTFGTIVENPRLNSNSTSNSSLMKRKSTSNLQTKKSINSMRQASNQNLIPKMKSTTSLKKTKSSTFTNNYVTDYENDDEQISKPASLQKLRQFKSVARQQKTPRPQQRRKKVQPVPVLKQQSYNVKSTYEPSSIEDSPLSKKKSMVKNTPASVKNYKPKQTKREPVQAYPNEQIYNVGTIEKFIYNTKGVLADNVNSEIKNDTTFTTMEEIETTPTPEPDFSQDITVNLMHENGIYEDDTNTYPIMAYEDNTKSVSKMRKNYKSNKSSRQSSVKSSKNIVPQPSLELYDKDAIDDEVLETQSHTSQSTFAKKLQNAHYFSSDNENTEIFQEDLEDNENVEENATNSDFSGYVFEKENNDQLYGEEDDDRISEEEQEDDSVQVKSYPDKPIQNKTEQVGIEEEEQEEQEEEFLEESENIELYEADQVKYASDNVSANEVEILPEEIELSDNQSTSSQDTYESNSEQDEEAEEEDNLLEPYEDEELANQDENDLIIGNEGELGQEEEEEGVDEEYSEQVSEHDTLNRQDHINSPEDEYESKSINYESQHSKKDEFDTEDEIELSEAASKNTTNESMEDELMQGNIMEPEQLHTMEKIERLVLSDDNFDIENTNHLANFVTREDSKSAPNDSTDELFSPKLISTPETPATTIENFHNESNSKKLGKEVPTNMHNSNPTTYVRKHSRAPSHRRVSSKKISGETIVSMNSNKNNIDQAMYATSDLLQPVIAKKAHSRKPSTNTIGSRNAVTEDNSTMASSESKYMSPTNSTSEYASPSSMKSPGSVGYEIYEAEVHEVSKKDVNNAKFVNDDEEYYHNVNMNDESLDYEENPANEEFDISNISEIKNSSNTNSVIHKDIKPRATSYQQLAHQNKLQKAFSITESESGDQSNLNASHVSINPESDNITVESGYNAFVDVVDNLTLVTDRNIESKPNKSRVPSNISKKTIEESSKPSLNKNVKKNSNFGKKLAKKSPKKSFTKAPVKALKHPTTPINETIKNSAYPTAPVIDDYDMNESDIQDVITADIAEANSDEYGTSMFNTSDLNLINKVSQTEPLEISSPKRKITTNNDHPATNSLNIKHKELQASMTSLDKLKKSIEKARMVASNGVDADTSVYSNDDLLVNSSLVREDLPQRSKTMNSVTRSKKEKLKPKFKSKSISDIDVKEINNMRHFTPPPRSMQRPTSGVVSMRDVNEMETYNEMYPNYNQDNMNINTDNSDEVMEQPKSGKTKNIFKPFKTMVNNMNANIAAAQERNRQYQYEDEYYDNRNYVYDDDEIMGNEFQNDNAETSSFERMNKNIDSNSDVVYADNINVKRKSSKFGSFKRLGQINEEYDTAYNNKPRPRNTFLSYSDWKAQLYEDNPEYLENKPTLKNIFKSMKKNKNEAYEEELEAYEDPDINYDEGVDVGYDDARKSPGKLGHKFKMMFKK